MTLTNCSEGFANCVCIQWLIARRREGKEEDHVLGVGCWISCIRGRKVEKGAGIEGLSGRKDDLPIGSRGPKEGYGIRFPEAGVSFATDHGKDLQVKLGMKKRLVPERQSRWHQERLGIRTGGSRLDEDVRPGA
jgi:hypothetical protein